MYESYAWPGVHNFKKSIFVKLFRQLFDGVLKEIEKREKSI